MTPQEQRIASERAKLLAMPQTREWKPLTKLPVAPHRPVYEAPGCIVRGEPDGVRLA